jgi:hypothetical protein
MTTEQHGTQHGPGTNEGGKPSNLSRGVLTIVVYRERLDSRDGSGKDTGETSDG